MTVRKWQRNRAKKQTWLVNSESKLLVSSSSFYTRLGRDTRQPQGSRAAKLLMTYKLGFDWWLNLHVADLVPVHGLEDGVLLSKQQREIGDWHDQETCFANKP